MADGPKSRATYEELLAVPENLVAEIIDGQLVTMPRPGGATCPCRVGARGGAGGGHSIGDVVDQLSGWRRTRMPELPDASAFELAPDWVCEVISPATAASDRVQKMPIYARERVGHLWLVDRS